jgi:D-alanyl-D-alanine dipeptidase/carboxypeptidase
MSMKKIILQRSRIYSGSLILVNRAYGYKEKDQGASLLPVLEQEPGILMQRRAAVLLFHLMNKINGWQGIVPVSGWRSGREQEEIWESSLKENGREFTETYVAYPGHSEHQSGLAIDLGHKQEEIDFIRPEFPDTGICGAFRRKAAKYGFIERYPRGREEVTGIGHEPWHFRYVGIPHARIMEQNKLTLEEYIDFLRQFPYGERAYRFSEDGQEFLIFFLKMPDRGNGPEREIEAGRQIEIDESHPYWISGNNVDGFVITQERSRHGR